jgi:rhodanese-related sulfurtransferase
MEKIFENISSKNAYDLINKENIIILDVRTKNEHDFEKISNSINIDYYSDNFKEKLLNLDKNKKYLVYCRSGARSNSAMKIMHDLKFTCVFNLAGGINSWQDNNLPLE